MVDAQSNRLFPSKVPPDSSALRYGAAPRRTPPPARPDTVALPYNMIWGDNMTRLASLFAGVGATITNKKTENSVETWTVQGLLAANLQVSLFRFSNSRLAALEFDYGAPDWDTAKYNDQMGQFRRLLDAKCEAPGEMISRQTDQPPDEKGITQSLMGYQWKRGDTLVQLFYFSAEDPANKALTFRNISLHYYYQDPNPPAPADVALPENANADPNASTLFGGKTPAGSAVDGTVPSPAPTPEAPPTPAPVMPWEYNPDVAPSPSPTPTPAPVRGNKGRRPIAPPDGDPLPE